MNKDFTKVRPGLYRIQWKSGITSEAAVGVNPNGTRWIAPTNWITPSELSLDVSDGIERMILVEQETASDAWSDVISKYAAFVRITKESQAILWPDLVAKGEYFDKFEFSNLTENTVDVTLKTKDNQLIMRTLPAELFRNTAKFIEERTVVVNNINSELTRQNALNTLTKLTDQDVRLAAYKELQKEFG